MVKMANGDGPAEEEFLCEPDDEITKDDICAITSMMGFPPPGTKLKVVQEICCDSQIPPGVAEGTPARKEPSLKTRVDPYRTIMPRNRQSSTDGPFYSTPVSELSLPEAQAELTSLGSRGLLKRWGVRKEELTNHIATLMPVPKPGEPMFVSRNTDFPMNEPFEINPLVSEKCQLAGKYVSVEDFIIRHEHTIVKAVGSNDEVAFVASRYNIFVAVPGGPDGFTPVGKVEFQDKNYNFDYLLIN